MADLDAKRFQKHFEKLTQTNAKVWETQSRYLQKLMERNVSIVSSLSRSQMNRLKELAESRDLTKIVKTANQFDKELRESLQEMYADNLQEWEALQSDLKDLYADDSELLSDLQHSASDLLGNAKKTAKSVMEKIKTSKTKEDASVRTKPRTKSPTRKAATRKPPSTKK